MGTCLKCKGTGRIDCPECKGRGDIYLIFALGPEGGLTLQKVDPDSIYVREGVIFHQGKPISHLEICSYCKGTKGSLCSSCQGTGIH